MLWWSSHTSAIPHSICANLNYILGCGKFAILFGCHYTCYHKKLQHIIRFFSPILSRPIQTSFQTSNMRISAIHENSLFRFAAFHTIIAFFVADWLARSTIENPKKCTKALQRNRYFPSAWAVCRAEAFNSIVAVCMCVCVCVNSQESQESKDHPAYITQIDSEQYQCWVWSGILSGRENDRKKSK